MIQEDKERQRDRGERLWCGYWGNQLRADSMPGRRAALIQGQYLFGPHGYTHWYYSFNGQKMALLDKNRPFRKQTTLVYNSPC